MTQYTKKQLELLRNWQSGNLHRINVLSGSVRSGKTWVSLVLWAFWVGTSPLDGTYMMCAKTMQSLKNNCLNLLTDLVGEKNFKFSAVKKEGYLFGRRIVLEGCNNSGAENRIRGITLSGAYCDELTLFTEGFFEMLDSRLSQPGAKLFATTNPDSPFHWLWVKFLSPERRDALNILYKEFLIDDNTTLDPEFVAHEKLIHTGVFYERFIMGRWVVSEGLIYPQFDIKKHVLEPPEAAFTRYVVSCDYGTHNPTSMGLWGLYNDVWYRIKEYYYDGRKNQPRTDEEHYRALEDLAKDIPEYVNISGFDGTQVIKNPVEAVVVDPSAAFFIELIRRKGEFHVQKANNKVVDGIRDVARNLMEGNIKIGSACKDSIREFQTYAWEENAKEDRPIKENDHAMDDIRYFVRYAFRACAVKF